MIVEQTRGWHPQDIKAAIYKRGSTLKAVAEAERLSESVCRAALLRPQPAGEAAISKFLGVSLHELWPDRYDSDGRQRTTRHERDENNTNGAETHRLTAEAR